MKRLILGDCIKIPMEDNSVDLVFTSPPYEDARTYGIDYKVKGQDWVDWCAPRFMECLRVSRGLVAWVLQGRTRNYKWTATPALLMADLHRAGVCLRNPPIFHRVGIPGSGGPDWLRSDYEWIVCATADRGKLPWSDNTAMGHPPKWGPGGEMSHRRGDGTRVNQWGHSIDSGATVVDEGGVVRSKGKRPSHVEINGGAVDRPRTKRGPDGAVRTQGYAVPVRANPGNVIHRVVGGGVMGSPLAHENEAPFPESLAEFFIKSFCPPCGVVLDPMCGSGTTLAAAEKCGRKGVGMDIRESQIELSTRRLEEVA